MNSHFLVLDDLFHYGMNEYIYLTLVFLRSARNNNPNMWLSYEEVSLGVATYAKQRGTFNYLNEKDFKVNLGYLIESGFIKEQTMAYRITPNGLGCLFYIENPPINYPKETYHLTQKIGVSQIIIAMISIIIGIVIGVFL